MVHALFGFVRGWDAWVWFGLFAQFFFFLRFFVQWIASERAKKIVIPQSFWYFSSVGGVLILIYSFVRKDIVFVLASALSLVMYVRNFILMYRQRASEQIDQVLTIP